MTEEEIKKGERGVRETFDVLSSVFWADYWTLQHCPGSSNCISLPLSKWLTFSDFPPWISSNSASFELKFISKHHAVCLCELFSLSSCCGLPWFGCYCQLLLCCKVTQNSNVACTKSGWVSQAPHLMCLLIPQPAVACLSQTVPAFLNGRSIIKVKRKEQVSNLKSELLVLVYYYHVY